MMAPRAWLLCLLLLGVELQEAAGRIPQHSMEARTPDIDPAWYIARGIRPVGRFGRSSAVLRKVPRPGQQCRLNCHPVPRGPEFPQDRS